MAEVTAALVKQLRDRTGAGMMDCKRALTDSAGEIESAVDWLRKKGLAAAAKKAGRLAAEGLVGLAAGDRVAALVEVNSETDFVARNEAFQDFVRGVAGVALAQRGDLAAVTAAEFPNSGRTVADELTHMAATIGENMQIRRAAAIQVDDGVVGSYVHGQVAPGLGRIGVIVGLESTADPEKLAALGKQLAMHVTAAAPQAVSVDDLDPAAVAREREVLREQARASGKPDEIVDKMVEGRLRKFYEDVVLLQQTYVIDLENEVKVGKAIEAAAKDLGAAIKVTGFRRFALGEGIEKDPKDFAAEVAGQLGG
jgi:elongation factor Ts